MNMKPFYHLLKKINNRIPVAFRTALSYETKWYSDEVLLVSNEKHVIINANESTTLVIKSVDVKDQHEYKVVITNAKETFTYKTYLHVTGNFKWIAKIIIFYEISDFFSKLS